MKGYHFLLLTLLITIGCASASKKSSQTAGILQGTTGVFEGNCMPSPGVPPCESRPTSLTVLITTPGESYDRDKLLKKVTSDEYGEFEVELESGKYSLFIQDGDEVICPRLNCPTACYCMLFEITAGSTTKLTPNLDKAAW